MSAAPRTMVSMPRVAMNAGTRNSVTMRPFIQPISAPLRTPKPIAGVTPICGTRLIVIQPANAAVEPTESSKFPLAIARVMPRPTIATTLALVQTLSRLLRVKNVGVRSVNAAPTTRSVSPTRERRKTAKTARLESIGDLHGVRFHGNLVGHAGCNFHNGFLRHLIAGEFSARFPSNKDDPSIAGWDQLGKF